MSRITVAEALDLPPGTEIELAGWIASKRSQSHHVFLDLVDATGRIQLVAQRETPAHSQAHAVEREASVRAVGKTQLAREEKAEVELRTLEVIGPAIAQVEPSPRSGFDPFDDRHLDQVLLNRHLYLRNEKFAATLRLRHHFLRLIRSWFEQNSFIEFHAPILTQLRFYDDSDSAFSLSYFHTKAYLTQCTAFYLESAIFAFERVYSISPSFRAEVSTGRRHLAEYWHLKGEAAFLTLEDLMTLLEVLLRSVSSSLGREAERDLMTVGVAPEDLILPARAFERVTYREALVTLEKAGVAKAFGASLSESDEALLSERIPSPFWLTALPRSIEPFPYVIDSTDTDVTRTADLIAPFGFGEILGVAEKLWLPDETTASLERHRGSVDPAYNWYIDLRKIGSVPHAGFGMGIERALRWFLRLGHVRDAIAYPRLARRQPNP